MSLYRHKLRTGRGVRVVPGKLLKTDIPIVLRRTAAVVAQLHGEQRGR